jgi:hypothetical protein
MVLGGIAVVLTDLFLVVKRHIRLKYSKESQSHLCPVH